MKTILCILLITALLAACQSTGLKIGNVDVGRLLHSGIKVWDANNIDEDQEIQLGENISSILLGVRPLHSNKEINAYVNFVGQWLASNSDRPNLPWHFGVIDSNAINAFATPGGFVFVTSGLLVQLNNEAELAAVLAHEIAHVTAKHHLEALKNGAMRSAFTETLFVSAEAYQANTNADREKRNYTTWAKTVTSAAQELYTRGLQRDDELAADHLGLALLVKSGYDPYAFVSCLQAIEAIAPDDSSLALMYQTHPSPTDRLAALAGRLTDFDKYRGKSLESRFVNILSGRRTVFVD